MHKSLGRRDSLQEGKHMSTDLVTLQPERDITPMDMLRIALTQGADIDKLQQLMEFKERWEANEARKEFDNAMA